MTTFRRSVHRSGRNTEDETGRIRITVIRLEPGAQMHAKGNITRTITLRDAKVSEVTQCIERALFGQEEA